jgi:cytochrome c553
MISRHHSMLTVLSIAGLALATPFATQAAPPPGRLLASQCAQCHGTNGHSVSGIDSLAGESAKELHDEMREMQNKTDHPDDIMHHIAAAYTDQQLWLIAQYFSTIPK